MMQFRNTYLLYTSYILFSYRRESVSKIVEEDQAIISLQIVSLQINNNVCLYETTSSNILKHRVDTPRMGTAIKDRN